MKKRVVNATEFKAKCSAFLDQVEQNGEPITILRRGRPVAVVGSGEKDSLEVARRHVDRQGRHRG